MAEQELHDCPACKGSGEGEHGDCRLCEGKGKAAANTLTLDPFNHWLCLLHGEPFREVWPTGMAALTIMVIGDVLQDPDLWATADAIVAADLKLTKPFEGVRAALLDVPACCRVSPHRLMRMYLDAKIGRLRRCVACRHTRQGTPMRSADPRTHKVTRLRHVCFHCVIHRAKDIRQS